MLVTGMTWNMCNVGKHPDDPQEAARYRGIESVVARHRPHVFFGQEFYMPADDAAGVVGRFAAAVNTDRFAGVKGNHANLGLGIVWRHPVVQVPGSWRLVSSDRSWHPLAGLTLLVDGLPVDHFVYHGPPRVGRDETLVERERVTEATMVAGALTGDGANPLGVVCGDWNWISADRTPDGSYHHPDPVVPAGLSEAAAALARSRAPGEVLWKAGLVSAAAHLGNPLVPSTGHHPPASLKGTDYGKRLIDEAFLTRQLAAALVGHWVVDTAETRRLSDHLPVVFTYDTDLIARQVTSGRG